MTTFLVSDTTAGVEAENNGSSSFQVRLDNFQGPFDLLLTLIHRHQLDVTEVALSQVTDDFISFLTAAGKDFDLGQATEFLVVAATLLDLKVARLLPTSDVENEEDLALLESRDLLFARLLQYRAYKLAAAHLGELDATCGRRFARLAELEERFANLNPEVEIGAELAQFAAIAAIALKPRPTPMVAVGHIHSPRVSVAEHMNQLRRLLSRAGEATFRSLVADCESTLEVVARFLGLLELYREGDVGFDQAQALAELRVRWLRPDGETDDRTDDGADDEIDGDGPAAEQAAVDREYG